MTHAYHNDPQRMKKNKNKNNYQQIYVYHLLHELKIVDHGKVFIGSIVQNDCDRCNFPLTKSCSVLGVDEVTTLLLPLPL
jgi:hypothetical protein